MPDGRRVRDSHDRIESELLRERAAALVRISSRLSQLIDRLATLRGELERQEHADPSAGLAAYRATRAEAVRYRWYLEVQREAIGLRMHDRLDDIYRIPEAIEAPHA